MTRNVDQGYVLLDFARGFSGVRNVLMGSAYVSKPLLFGRMRNYW